MKSKKLFAFREFIVVLLSGGLPVLLAYFMGGIELLNSTISSLISPDLLIYYAIIVAVLFFVFYWIDDSLYIDPLSRKQKVLNFIVSSLAELSTNILGIFRVASGLLIVFPIMVLINEPESFQAVGIEFIGIGFVGMLECGIFCWFYSKVSLKQKF